MRILQTYQETSADGPGLRYAIYVAGCDLKCDGCHNPQSWDFDQGERLSPAMLSRIKTEISSNPMLTGITISGGDPLHPDNAFGTQMLLESLQDLNKHIMVYTGRVLKQLIKRPINAAQLRCLKYIDVLVDGPFVKNLRDVTTFRGSSNQMFIRVKDMVNNNDLQASKTAQYIINCL